MPYFVISISKFEKVAFYIHQSIKTNHVKITFNVIKYFEKSIEKTTYRLF